MTNQSDLVLITGATGYLGHLVALEALKRGYRIRIAVRSQSKIEELLSSPSIKALDVGPEQITWVRVPDMAAPGAYDEAVKGVKYIIHAASPIPTFGGPNPPAKGDYEAYFVKPAVAGDMGMLESAAKERSVRRIILTSSVVAIIPFDYFLGKGDPDRVFTAADRIPFDKGPWEFEFQAYSAGKAAALNAAEAFVRDKKPRFDLIPIVPGWIFGRNDLIKNAEGMRSESTNSVLLAYLTGAENPIAYNGNMVLGEDVARIHVLALDPAVEGNRAFLASVDGTWEDALKILQQQYADAIADGRLSLKGRQDTLHLNIPSDETEAVFKCRLRPFQTMVTEVVDQYLELSGA